MVEWIKRTPAVWLLFAMLVAGSVLYTLRKDAGRSQRISAGDRVLATVNGRPITEAALERAIDDSLGDYTQSQLGKDSRRKFLESLVASRAIADAAEKALSSEQAAEIERRLESHREQLLVNEYLKKHAPPEPVTTEMVKKYYDEHPERFGGTKTIDYGMVFTERPLNEGERQGVLDVLKAITSEKDWRASVDEARKKGKPLTYREGALDPRTLDARLATLIRSVPEGGVSEVSFIDGKAYLVRVTGAASGTARPLSEVSADIRRELTPVQAKAAVKKASERALKDAKVEYR